MLVDNINKQFRGIMNWYMDVFGDFWGVFLPFSSLITIFIFRYRQKMKRFRKWQFMTVGVNSRARYEALKASNLLLTSRTK